MKLIRVPSKPKTYLDVIKLLAILMVVFNHSGSNGYKMYLDVMAAPAHQLLTGFSALIKIAVPLFFMTTGALLLRRDEPYGQTLMRRVVRFAIVLVLVSFFFYYDAHGRSGTLSLTDFLIHLYRNDLTGHLWYLYSYLCFLILLPFLRALAKAMKPSDYLLLLVVWQAAQLLPALDYAIFRGAAVHTSYISLFTAENYVVYPLLGYFIDSRTDEEEREETFYVLLFLSALAIFCTCLLMDWRRGLDGGWTASNREAYMGSLSVLPAVTVFYGVKRLFDAHPVKGRAARLLFVLGSCTFGVYLFDPKWRQLTQGVRTLLSPVLGLFGATLVQTVCACLLGLAATFAFKCAVGGVMLLVSRIAAADEPEQPASLH